MSKISYSLTLMLSTLTVIITYISTCFWYFFSVFSYSLYIYIYVAYMLFIRVDLCFNHILISIRDICSADYNYPYSNSTFTTNINFDSFFTRKCLYEYVHCYLFLLYVFYFQKRIKPFTLIHNLQFFLAFYCIV